MLFGKTERKRPLERPRHWWEDKIKVNFKERGFVDADWIHVAQDRTSCCELGNAPSGSIKMGRTYWPAERLLTSEKLWYMGLVSTSCRSYAAWSDSRGILEEAVVDFRSYVLFSCHSRGVSDKNRIESYLHNLSATGIPTGYLPSANRRLTGCYCVVSGLSRLRSVASSVR
jgi:hypothetical protein